MGEHCSGIDFAEQQGCLTSQGLPEVAARVACRHEEMKRLPLTLPAVGSTYPFDIDGSVELRTIESVDLGRGLMFLASNGHPLRPTFINDVVRMVRPNDAAAWLPLLREHYSMDNEGRAALIAEAKQAPCSGHTLAIEGPVESGPYTAMGPVCHNGEDLARAFPQVPNDAYAEAFQRTHERDLYTTIGDPVPPLVWPRQESPTRGETTMDEAPVKVLESAMSTAYEEAGEWAGSATAVEVSPAKPHVFKAGERVIVARKVERDSTGHWCFWPKYHDVLGLSGVVSSVDPSPGASVFVEIAGGGGQHYLSPEALDLVTSVAAVAFKPGDTVKVARKITTDSKGRDCHWSPDMNTSVGATQTVTHVELDNGMDSIPVRLDNAQWYSPEALDLVAATE